MGEEAERSASRKGIRPRYPLSVRSRVRLAAIDKKYRSIIENIRDIVFKTDNEGRATFLNSLWAEITGFSVAESLGRPFTDFLHADERSRCLKPFRRLMAGEIDNGWGQLRFLAKRGDPLWMEVYIRPVLAADGTVVGTAGTLRDISDRKWAEQALAESEERYRQLFMNSRVVKLVVDPDNGRIIDANTAAADFYGYSVEELRRLKLFALTTSEPAEVMKYLADAQNSQSRILSSVRHRLKDGSLRDVEVYRTPVTIGGKTLLHSVIFDVTARRRMEEQLARSQERLALVLAGAKAGIWDWDIISGHVYYDKRWKAILGYEEDEMGADYGEWRSRLHPEDAARVDRTVEDYLSGLRTEYSIEYRLRHKDGTYRWVLTTGKVTCDPAGLPVRWTGSSIDITDRKSVEELLVASEAKLRDFAQAMPDASFIVDEDGLFVEAFGGNGYLLPLGNADLPGRTVGELLPAALTEMLLGEIRRTIEEGLPRSRILEMRTGGGEKVVEGRTAPMKYAVNGKRTVVLVLNDITDRLRTERLLDYAYRLRRRSDFINDIIEGKPIVCERDRYFAQTLGLDTRLPAFCCLVLSDLLDVGKQYKHAEGSLGLHKFKESAIEVLEGLANAVSWDCREGIGVLCRMEAGARGTEDSRAAASEIMNRLRQQYPGISFFIGVSEIHHTFGDIRKMYQEAYRAVLAARSEGVGGNIVHHRDAGVFQFIPDVGDREFALEFVERQIGRLLEYDRRKGTDYLATLEELLRGSSLREAADKLFVHPKSLLFRRGRIQAILQVSLDSPETRLALALAVKLLKLYNK